MTETICGVDCGECMFKDNCGGCGKTNGRPFGGECVVAVCCKTKGHEYCAKCADAECGLKQQLIAEFNALGIADMPPVTGLNSLKGAFVNLEYAFPNGQAAKLLDDNKIYMGTQVPKNGSDRCYGLAADEKYLLVCEYGDNGADAEIVIYKRR